MLRYFLLAAALAVPASALAAVAQPAPASSERRLTPQEIERILDEASARREAAEAAAPNASGPKISGEMGVSIGTGGYRSAFGSAYVPLEDGFASFSFSTERSRDGYGVYDSYDGYGIYGVR